MFIFGMHYILDGSFFCSFSFPFFSFLPVMSVYTRANIISMFSTGKMLYIPRTKCH